MLGVADAGVEGVMRSCCEKTLGVLQKNKESLITIIEVAILHAIPKAYVHISVLTIYHSLCVGLALPLHAVAFCCRFQGKHQTRRSSVDL